MINDHYDTNVFIFTFVFCPLNIIDKVCDKLNKYSMQKITNINNSVLSTSPFIHFIFTPVMIIAV